MKRRSILFILLLLLIFFTCAGCSVGESSVPQDLAAVPEEASIDDVSDISVPTERQTAISDTATLGNLELEMEILEEQKAANLLADVKDISGIFEGLEDNHTALFSFDGVERTFFFEDPAVQKVLSEAVIGSTYTLSYSYDSSTGLNVLYEISE